MSLNVIGLFCEDIREEKSGTVTLVGLLPDNLSVDSTPGLLPKLSFYVRVHFTPTEPPKKILVQLLEPDGQIADFGSFEKELIADAASSAQASGLPLTGLVLHGTAAPFHVRAPGQVHLRVNVDDRLISVGVLNIQLKSDAQSRPPEGR